MMEVVKQLENLNTPFCFCFLYQKSKNSDVEGSIHTYTQVNANRLGRMHVFFLMEKLSGLGWFA